ncbi:hypothetical protein BJY01DRAFT_261265 [Aspergillus pseudoustus]|uniref:Glutathione S-transferase n=1 Tax=Aspergillus pseudoustus TaxID=1810923 RepID=A0ABR4INP7_9EURO
MSDQLPKITLHWLDKSRSHRILFLLEELQLPYELKIYKRNPITNLAGSALKLIHPLGKFPVIEVRHEDQEETIVIAESAVIVEYLVENFGRHLLPDKDDDGRDDGRHNGDGDLGERGPNEEGRTATPRDISWLRYKYFLHYAEGSVMNVLLIAVMVTFLRTTPLFLLVRPLARAIAWQLEKQYVKNTLVTHIEFLEDELSKQGNKGDFFVGDKLTGADIMMSFPVEVLKARGDLDSGRYPFLVRYLERLKSRETWKRADAKIFEVTGVERRMDIR